MLLHTIARSSSRNSKDFFFIQMQPSEIEIKETTESKASASFIDENITYDVHTYRFKLDIANSLID